MFAGIIVAILALSVMVFIHEFFHLVVAKWSSMHASVFSIGFGPKLFSFFKWGETEFRVSAIPFGGYVEIKGMDPEEMKGEEDEFYSKNFFLKTSVAIAGPFANFTLGFIIYFSIILFHGIEVTPATTVKQANAQSNLEPNDRILKIEGKKVSNWYEITQNLKANSEVLLARNGEKIEVVVDSIMLDSLIPLIPPQVEEVIENMPAEEIGMKKGDRILKIQDEFINSWDEITSLIKPAPEETLDIVLLSDGDTVRTKIVPESQKSMGKDSVINIGIIGIKAPTSRININPIKAVSFAWAQSWSTASLIFRTISWLFQRKVSPKNLAGAVGIVVYTKKSMEMGLMKLLTFIALITINLAVVNLLPIPPLDGFHIAMSIATFTSRKPPSKTLLKIVQTIGTFILLSLMALLLLNDIFRLIRGKF